MSKYCAAQDFADTAGNTQYTRIKNNGTWLEWQRIMKIIPLKFLASPLTKTNREYVSEDLVGALEIIVYYTFLYSGNRYRGSVTIPRK